MMKSRVFVFVLAAVMFAAGCAHKGTLPLSPEDTPSNHYLQGMKLIDSGRLSEAQSRFERALKLDLKYAPAIAGQALVVAAGVAQYADVEHKAIEEKRYRDLLDEGVENAGSLEERFIVATTAIRAETVAMGSSWLNAAAKWFELGHRLKSVDEARLAYYRNVEALDYFMGEARFRGGEYGRAREALARVVGTATGKWHKPAEALYKRAQKIERATANYTVTDVSWSIASREIVSRGDVAALLVNELDLDTLFSGKLSEAPLPEPTFIPADIMDHRFKREILDVLKWDVRGMEPVYDPGTRAELFRPEAPVSRKQMAMILEDVLIRITGNEELASRYFGQSVSPYPDVKPTEAVYNAVVNAVTRNLMETDLSGAFRPDDDMDGADLLLAVVRLRNTVKQ